MSTDPETIALAPEIAPLKRRGLVLAAVAGLAAAAVLRFQAPPRDAADDVPPAEAAKRVLAMQHLPPLPLTPVGGDEWEAALASLALSSADEARLRADVMAGRLRLAWLSLFDSDAEDGDCVRVESMGVTHSMLLSKRPVPVAVPLPVTGRIVIAAVDEGLGGGVTVGVVAGGQSYKLPPMKVGQAFSLLVAVP